VKRYALIAAAAAALGGAATAEGRNAASYFIGGGDIVQLSGTKVVCSAGKGQYGTVMFCGRAGSNLFVWIGQKEVFLTHGDDPSAAGFGAVATYSGWRAP
jgi:hypothetical protein